VEKSTSLRIEYYENKEKSGEIAAKNKLFHKPLVINGLKAFSHISSV